jgi:nucleotidyltransferase/DNA polymerase involved in DNA repair
MVEFPRGDDPRQVQVSRRAKSVSNETTFEEDTNRTTSAAS